MLFKMNQLNGFWKIIKKYINILLDNYDVRYIITIKYNRYKSINI